VAGRIFDDKQRKKICADYVLCENYSEVARKWHCSVPTVKKIVTSDKDCLNQLKQKKENNTKSILQYMDSRKNEAMLFMDAAIQALNDPDKLKVASVKDIAIAYGIVYDKYVGAE